MILGATSHCGGPLCSNGRHFMPLGTLVSLDNHASFQPSSTWIQVESNDERLREVFGPHIASLSATGAIVMSYQAPASSQPAYFRVYVGTTPIDVQFSPKKKSVSAALVRESWEALLQVISRSPSHWDARESADQDSRWPFEADPRTLSEIFTDLAPPSPKKEFLDTVDEISPLLHYPLYSFQRATVAQMLEREIANTPQADPTFARLHSIERGSSHQALWVQPSSMHICLEPPNYMSKESGGILSEEMGAGKTVILLALIMATRDNLASPDGSENGNIVLSSLSLQYSQTEYHRQLRQRHSIPEPERMLSLQENIFHFLACRPDCIADAPYGIRELFNSSSLAQIPSRLSPFYFEDVSNPRSVRKGEKYVSPPIKLFLARATLVVVPASLYEQWKGEIYKFCRDGTLKVLFAKDIGFRLPKAAELASYDLVLSTIEWLSTTNRKSVASSPDDICRCAGDTSYPSIPLCTCQDDELISPIFRCRWKRLVIDEGHNSAYLTTEYSTAASKLRVDRRWIVTGTPTQNLIGSIATPKAREKEAEGIENGGWTKEDEKDMRRLANMIGRYLLVEPFFSQKEYFDRNVSLPLRKGWRGAREILGNVMQHCMIRHPIEIVEAEVNLPPMTQQVVLLRLEPLQLRTYNTIQSTIVTNAVDSERTDEDYIFHPNNAKFLQATFANLLQSLFWHADQDFFDNDIESHLHNAKESIGRAIERGRIAANDLALLKEANHILGEAVHDNIWRLTMRREDVPYLTLGIEPQIQLAFSRYGANAPLYHPDRLLKLRNVVCEDIDVDIEKLLLIATETEKQDELKEAFVQMHKENMSKNKASSRLPKRNPDAGQVKARTVVKSRGTSSLFDGRVLSSSSSKINFIIEEVLTYGNEEKFLIFSSSLLSLLHLSEALQVANIPHLEYTSECSPDQRRVNITQFNNVPIYRVFLMELKHGARGLNLVTASRVLFTEPVWAPDVEAQAIKRVHRTGQTRPVVVKTLAIRNTVEEEMLERRAGIVAKTTRMPPLTEEVGMRRYIENPKFLTESGNGTNWSIPLVPVRIKGSGSGVLRELATTKPMDVDPTSPEKRKLTMDDTERSAKRVRFASPGDGVAFAL